MIRWICPKVVEWKRNHKIERQQRQVENETLVVLTTGVKAVAAAVIMHLSAPTGDTFLGYMK